MDTNLDNLRRKYDSASSEVLMQEKTIASIEGDIEDLEEKLTVLREYLRTQQLINADRHLAQIDAKDAWDTARCPSAEGQ
jgi:peptidoglycan hydrolase CwlO-like protein